MTARSMEPPSARGSLSYRVLTTRVSDLARGEITGPYRRLSRRTAYVRLIAASELPDRPKDLIRHVVQRTRLWPGERTEVAKELIAHFREGLETGASAETLVRGFGEVRTAAILIRRAKKRTRPAAWRAWNRSRQAFAAVSVLVLVVYGVLAARFYSGSPVIARNFVAEMNTGVEDIPEVERAWPKYVAAFEYFRELPKELKNSPWPRVEPGDEFWEAALAYNARMQPGIVLAIEAAKRPDLGLVVTDRMDPLLAELFYRQVGLEMDSTPPQANPPLISVQLNQLGILRNVARHLAFDARRAAGDGDAARVVADIGALVGAARHARQHPLLICRMVGDAIHAEASRATQRVMANHAGGFADDQLIALAHVFAAAPIRPLSPTEIDAERVWFDDFVQRAYTDDGHGGGRLTPEGVEAMRRSDPQIAAATAQTWGPPALAPLLTFNSPGRRDAIREYDRLVRESLSEIAVPIWERGASEVQADLRATSGRDRSTYAPRPARVYFPPIQGASTMVERAAHEVEVATVAIALELFRRRHERYPAALDELVPEYLPAVPTDRFDGRPMRYVIADGVPIVYSIGADLDDDGGRAPTSEKDRGRVRVWPASITPWFSPEYLQRPIPDGDWVLYSPGGDGAR